MATMGSLWASVSPSVQPGPLPARSVLEEAGLWGACCPTMHLHSLGAARERGPVRGSRWLCLPPSVPGCPWRGSWGGDRALVLLGLC